MNEKYYDHHTCACGCGRSIQIKKHHSYYGIPKFIKGHGRKGRTNSPEHNKAISAANSGINNPAKRPDVRRKNSLAHKGVPLGPFTDEHQRNIKIAALRPETKRKKARSKCYINALERRLLSILEDAFPGEFAFTGNYQFRIGRRWPDFTNIRGQRKVIDMFGNYWHSEAKTGQTHDEHEAERRRYYRGFEWDSIVVWENELENTERLNQRIYDFIEHD